MRTSTSSGRTTVSGSRVRSGAASDCATWASRAPATRRPNAGHHHLFVDIDESIKPGAVIPADKNHIHFGAGQSEARVDLPPGRHTLQLVLGDAEHKVFDPPVVSKKITVTVY